MAAGPVGPQPDRKPLADREPLADNLITIALPVSGFPHDQGGQSASTGDLLANLALLCRFHHLIAVHRWGWILTCHPDGTATATGPDGRILHSHSPPRLAA